VVAECEGSVLHLPEPTISNCLSQW